MKCCKECGIEKELSEFYFYRRGDKITYYARCNVCHRTRLKDKYGPTGQKAANRRGSRQTAMDFVNANKVDPCYDCGVSYPPYVMDFDHVRGTKFRNIAKMVGRNSISSIKEEIEKCDLVCSNCHRIRTYNRRLAHAR